MKRSFTLTEVLVALLLLLLLSGAVAGFLRQLRGREETLMRMAQDRAAATMLIELLESDAMTCVAGRAGEPGVLGNEHTLEILSRGVTVAAGYPAAEFNDLRVTRYDFDPSSGSITISRAAHGDGGEPSTPEVLSNRVARLRFRYHDGDEWVGEFDCSKAGRLPVAIEVAVWFASPMEQRGGPTPTFAPAAPAVSGDSADAASGAGGGGSWPEPDRIRIIAIADAREWGGDT